LVCWFVFSKYQQLKLAKYCEDILDEYLLKRPIDNMPVTAALFVVLCINHALMIPNQDFCQGYVFIGINLFHHHHQFIKATCQTHVLT